jgi:hypothetical protein
MMLVRTTAIGLATTTMAMAVLLLLLVMVYGKKLLMRRHGRRITTMRKRGSLDRSRNTKLR